MYSVTEIFNKCKEFSLIHFNMDFNEKIRISKRMTKSWASCNWNTIIKNGTPVYEIKELVFAYKMFQNPEYDNSTLDKIILHELAHWYLIKQNYDAGHNKDFKSLCSRIGGDLGYANTEIKECGIKNYYIIVCSECGGYMCVRVNQPTEKLMTTHCSSCCKAPLKNIGKYEIQLDNVNGCIDKIISEYKIIDKTVNERVV